MPQWIDGDVIRRKKLPGETRKQCIERLTDAKMKKAFSYTAYRLIKKSRIQKAFQACLDAETVQKRQYAHEIRKTIKNLEEEQQKDWLARNGRLKDKEFWMVNGEFVTKEAFEQSLG